MAVRLRLRRMGKKKQPFYRIVAIDSRSARDGKYIESLGTYDPRRASMALQLTEERALYWLEQGAKPSETVYGLLKRKGILLRRHLKARGADEARILEETQKWEAAQADRQKRLEAAKAQRKMKAKAKPAEAATEKPASVESPAEGAGAEESPATSGS